MGKKEASVKGKKEAEVEGHKKKDAHLKAAKKEADVEGHLARRDVVRRGNDPEARVR